MKIKFLLSFFIAFTTIQITAVGPEGNQSYSRSDNNAVRVHIIPHTADEQFQMSNTGPDPLLAEIIKKNIYELKNSDETASSKSIHFYYDGKEVSLDTRAIIIDVA